MNKRSHGMYFKRNMLNVGVKFVLLWARFTTNSLDYLHSPCTGVAQGLYSEVANEYESKKLC